MIEDRWISLGVYDARQALGAHEQECQAMEDFCTECMALRLELFNAEQGCLEEDCSKRSKG